MNQTCSTCRQPIDWRGICPWCQADATWREQDPAGWEASRIRRDATQAFNRLTARLPIGADQGDCDRINADLLIAYRQADGLDGGRSADRFAGVMEEAA